MFGTYRRKLPVEDSGNIRQIIVASSLKWRFRAISKFNCCSSPTGTEENIASKKTSAKLIQVIIGLEVSALDDTKVREASH